MVAKVAEIAILTFVDLSSICGSMLNIHSYETFGTQDGPGIRLVIFLQGCNFRCAYCQNPDTIPLLEEGRSLMSAEEILELALKQKEYFGEKGGVTFSGGEPLLQAKALVPVLKLLQEHGITTCLDTNASLLTDDVKECLRYTDFVLPDIKHINAEAHKKLTEQDNQTPLAFIRYLDTENKKYWIRYVVVPGYTDGEEDIRRLGEFLTTLTSFQSIELLPFHNLGKHKRDQLGLNYPMEGVHASTIVELDRVKKILNAYTEKVLIRG